jgi:hypothetical protein
MCRDWFMREVFQPSKGNRINREDEFSLSRSWKLLTYFLNKWKKKVVSSDKLVISF